MRYRLIFLLTAAVLSGAPAAWAVPSCHISYGTAGSAKPNKLYLYFPTTDDATYPEFGTSLGLPPTSPAHAFNIAELPNYAAIPGATVGALRDAIFDVVTDDYCEFNVEVIQTTTAPATAAARRNTVSIGTDSGASAGGLFGLAQNVDTGDPTAVDFAHEWAATYQGLYGSAGGALEGANSTLERWARAIGGTAAHEGGHNYGLSHSDGLVLATGEDPLTHHIMASGSHFSGEDRAGYRRHFSDHEYSILAANVGLSVQTVWNWDLTNPNMQTGYKLRMEILSTQPSLTINWSYSGTLSPWINPTVSSALGTTMFKGVTYNRFQVTWSTGQAWSNGVPGGPGTPGAPGQVPGGIEFHVGAGFSGVDYNLPDPIIVSDVVLLDASNTPLALHPRALGFDAGTLDAADGSFNIAAVNVNGAPLQLEAIRVMELPRLLSIDAMVRGNERLLDPRKTPFRPWSESKLTRPMKLLEKGGTHSVPIARLSRGRHVVQRVTEKDCAREDRLQGPDVAKCKPGVQVDLFPATSVFVTATVVDPNAKHWDAKQKAYVTGPLRSQVFVQVAGRHPDLNKNGVDDYIDVTRGRSKDGNRDGVPDEIQLR